MDAATDATATVAALKAAVAGFAAARAWEPYHSPKNLVMALAAEAAELLEHFLWVECDASRRVTDDPAKREAVEDELADVFNVVLNLALSLDADLASILRRKMAKNAVKYPPPG